MDKTYQDVHFEHFRENDEDTYILRQLKIERIDFMKDYMVIVAKDSRDRPILMPLPKLQGYKLIID